MPAPATWRNTLLVLLSLAAGCLDAVGFLGFGEVFVANMTGNTVLLGIAVGQGDGEAVLRAGTALGGFICGVAVGAVVVGRKRERPLWPRAVTAALVIELFVLAAFAAGWLLFAGAEPTGRVSLVLISLSALAMGVQSSAVRRLGVPGVATTYVTGTLTNLTEGAIDWLRATRPKVSDEDDEGSSEQEAPSARGLLLPADVWLAYGTGAVAGGAAQLLWWPAGVLLPAGVVAVVVCIAAIRQRRG